MDWTILYVIGGVALNGLLLWFWKPWAKAYSEEKGKNLARKEDLDAILAEVRAVTITQKEIESQLSGRLWDKQTNWHQKRDIYGELLEHLQESGTAYGELPFILKMRADPRPAFKAEASKALTPCLSRIRDSQVLFGKTAMLALIFTSPECVQTLREFIKAKTKCEGIPTVEWSTLEGDRCNVLVGTLTQIAKRDLGIT